MIKLQITENPLRPGEYMFQVSTEDALTTADICRRSVENNGKVDYNTMMAAIAQFEQQARKDLLEGKKINTTLYHAQACAHGSTHSGRPTWGGDPNHYLEPRFTARPDVKEELNRQLVEVIDIKQVGPQIFDLYDYYSQAHIGQPDPSGVIRSAVTPKRNLRIEGMMLRVMGEPANTDWGIYLIPLAMPQAQVKIPPIDIIKNDPRELVVVLPSLQPGEYYIEVRTYGDKQGARFVSKLRTTRFKHAIIVEQE